MPIYEYQCEKCNHIHEVIVKITEKLEEMVECPKCHFWSKRKISKSTFILSDKGEVGWSKEGYKSKGKSKQKEK